jgi:CheY-like chemotaxis protein
LPQWSKSDFSLLTEVGGGDTLRAMCATPSVLIVDASADNREVLRTVLARRGMTIFEAEAANEGLALARLHHPDVILLDLETDPAERDAVREQFAAEASGHAGQLIVVGQLRRDAVGAAPVFAGGHVISKPYHFAPLIHTIERMAAKAA